MVDLSLQSHCGIEIGRSRSTVDPLSSDGAHGESVVVGTDVLAESAVPCVRSSQELAQESWRVGQRREGDFTALTAS